MSDLCPICGADWSECDCPQAISRFDAWLIEHGHQEMVYGRQAVLPNRIARLEKAGGDVALLQRLHRQWMDSQSVSVSAPEAPSSDPGPVQGSLFEGRQ